MGILKKVISIVIVSILLTLIIPYWNNYEPVDTQINFNDTGTVLEQGSSTTGTRGPRVGKVSSTKQAAYISDEGMKTAKEMLKRAWTENLTEADVAQAIKDKMEGMGSSELVDAFAPLVMSGNDTGIAGGHGDPSNDDVNQILPGEVVVIDIGARINGYVSDITRTFFMGEPTDEQRLVYQIIKEAQVAAMAEVKHGVPGRDIDLAGRRVIEEYGYGEHFSHALGHGIGLYVHVPPNIGPNSEDTVSKLQDHIITIEPGIYIEDDFGVRIEDDVTVEWLGYELITFYTRDIEDIIIHQPEVTEEAEKSDEQDWWDSETGRRNLIVGVVLVIAIVVAMLFIFRTKMKQKAMKLRESIRDSRRISEDS